MQADSTLAVLVVDDDALILEVVRTALEEGGFDVKTAIDGGDAVRIVEEARGLAALVTDVWLGGEPDGWEVARRAREGNPALVVYMSGEHGEDWASRGVPNSLMLQKPFAPAQIVTAVATLINDAPGPSPSP